MLTSLSLTTSALTSVWSLVKASSKVLPFMSQRPLISDKTGVDVIDTGNRAHVVANVDEAVGVYGDGSMSTKRCLEK